MPGVSIPDAKPLQIHFPAVGDVFHGGLAHRPRRSGPRLRRTARRLGGLPGRPIALSRHSPDPRRQLAHLLEKPGRGRDDAVCEVDSRRLLLTVQESS